MIQVVDAIFTAVAEPYWAKVLVPVVPADDRYMVSLVIAILTLVADKLMKVNAVPIAYPTLEFAGIVHVAAEPDPR